MSVGLGGFGMLCREGLLEKVSVYHGYVRPYTESCSGISSGYFNLTETTFDKKDSTGNLLTSHPEPFQLMNLARYLNWDPFEDPTSLHCDILPICMRGCAYSGIKIAKDKNCSAWRFYLTEMLKINYQLRLKRDLNAFK